MIKLVKINNIKFIKVILFWFFILNIIFDKIKKIFVNFLRLYFINYKFKKKIILKEKLLGFYQL